MKREVSVSMNGNALKDVHAKILAVRVQENPTADETVFDTVARLPGRKLAFKKRASMTVSVFCKVRELYDLTTRMDVINAVNVWAISGKELSVSYRPDQILRVALVQPATPGNIREYNGEIELVFEADGSPYWESENASRKQSAGSVISSTMTIEGSAPTPVDAAIYFIKAPTSFKIAVADTFIHLSGLSLPVGAYVTIEHDDIGVAKIMYGDTSLFEFLTDDSFDMLITSGGNAAVSFETDGDAEVTFTALGRFF